MSIVSLIQNSKDLELFAVSFFQTKNYYVENNLKWTEDSVTGIGKFDILEIDVLAYKYDKNQVIVLLIECKRGCKFNDLMLFSGVSKIVNADINILLCQSNNMYELSDTAEKLSIEIVSPEILASSLDATDELNFSFYYKSNKVIDKFFDKQWLLNTLNKKQFNQNETTAYNSIRTILSILIGKVWKISNVIDRANLIYTIMESNKDYVRSIARILKIKPSNKNSEYYIESNSFCQVAAFLVLKLRVSYIITAIHCAFELLRNSSINLNDVRDVNFMIVVKKIKDNIGIASRIPVFLQTFILIFGGVLCISSKDIDNIAGYMKMSKSQLFETIELLKDLFKLAQYNIQWGFTTDLGILSMKYIPNAIKGLGMYNRENLGFEQSDFIFQAEWKNALNNI